jgi:hypothetical protein
MTSSRAVSLNAGVVGGTHPVERVAITCRIVYCVRAVVGARRGKDGGR